MSFYHHTFDPSTGEHAKIASNDDQQRYVLPWTTKKWFHKHPFRKAARAKALLRARRERENAAKRAKRAEKRLAHSKLESMNIEEDDNCVPLEPPPKHRKIREDIDYSETVLGHEVSSESPVICWACGATTCLPFIPDPENGGLNVLQKVCLDSDL